MRKSNNVADTRLSGLNVDTKTAPVLFIDHDVTTVDIACPTIPCFSTIYRNNLMLKIDEKKYIANSIKKIIKIFNSVFATTILKDTVNDWLDCN